VKSTIALKSLTSPSHRIVATLFDLAIVITASLLLMLPSIAALMNAYLDKSPWTITASFIVTFISGGLIAIGAMTYQVVLPYRWKGQTLGMRFFRIKMVGEEGEECGITPLLVESAVSITLAFATFGVYFLVEFIAVLMSSNHRCFTDTVSRIYVIDIDEN